MALFLSTGAIALFSFLAVAAWSDSRRQEREAYYKNETLKKVSEAQGDNPVVAVIREEEKNALRRLREGIKLGGLVTAAIGIG
jgi:FtsZ-interacting cell division protein ZipA